MVSEQTNLTGHLLVMDTRAKVVDENLKKLDLVITGMGTSLKAVFNRLENKLGSTDQTLQVIEHRQKKIEASMFCMNHKYENLVAMLTQLSSDIKMGQKNKGVEETVVKARYENVISIPKASNTESNTYTRGDFKGNNRLAKSDFPHFGGEGPSEWLGKARKYFQMHQVPHELRLGIAKMYLEGKAYIWFYGFNASHPNADWGMFSKELCRRFADNTGEEVIESYSKIRQVGTMAEHLESEESEPKEGQGGEEVMEISIGGLARSLKHKTIRVPGVIKGKKVSILIDSGSTHNFVDEKLIRELNYAIDEAKEYPSMHT